MSSNKFWDFSLALYAKPDVATRCLELQDYHGANVNILLWSLWLEEQGIALNSERLNLGLSAIKDWNSDYVEVLRRLRRDLKLQYCQPSPLIENLRSYIKKAELAAEEFEQKCLADLVCEWEAFSEQNHQKSNLQLYLSHLGLSGERMDSTMHFFAEKSNAE